MLFRCVMRRTRYIIKLSSERKKHMIKKLTVIGAGTMGAGIAQVAIECGIEATLCDIKDEFVDRGINTIKTFVGRKLEKGKLTQADYDQIMGRLKGTSNMAEAVAGIDMVIEAVFEDYGAEAENFYGS